ncbi:aminotransferase class III-fold pyridoxal phosphate-dependent enzyme [Blastopirellula sp. JC732]|uniref:Aminotransferase class III-fold pyridoxal phosphate-dependent enzyme n=1 Tax=Blastopirellula sediminis TaxID=2894196 RepID=A0A9X1MLF0_9BACT|nr:aminotransferase class III-fold pyridoxal phosphate-dependent enzyme [Blastopirellula sediminis]MCC9609166.1 aminotransferase class III-fold pyridoxal phosphate-dependent enzyme [Blastopirellula sediminis]MCC9628057.1 aminotransferase class III-fold pyridoxal phosphate-dependent enzyme [Blastopirellula sediminis]
MDEPKLTADLLKADWRVVKAKRLLREALAEHSENLTRRDPSPELEADYAAALEQFAQLRGNPLYFPFLGSGVGRGSLVELADGSVKYDMISGIGVHVCGHSMPELVDVLTDAVIADTVMQGNLQQNRESLEVSERLVALARQQGAPLDHCFLTSSGAMANENALKILFQYRPGSHRILAFDNAFAGRSLVLSQITDRPQYRAGLPATIPVDFVPFFDPDHAEVSQHDAVAALHMYLSRYPGAHCGFMMELVQGEGGYRTAPHSFFAALCQELRQAGVPIYFDEIQTFGRTLAPFAYQMLELDQYADIVTVGKMTQVCATLFGNAMNPKPGLLSQTFTASTTALIAAKFILHKLEHGGFYGPDGRNAQIHRRFCIRFEKLHRQHPELIRGPWGVGGMVAFTALDGSPTVSKRVLTELFSAGVIAFAAGSDPTRIRFLPSLLAVTDDEIDSVCDILEQTLLRLHEE